MKPPWHPSLSNPDNAELEALQTDVMRFVAIIGLCLAAIFSLVNSASNEKQRASEVVVASRAPEPGKGKSTADNRPVEADTQQADSGRVEADTQQATPTRIKVDTQQAVPTRVKADTQQADTSRVEATVAEDPPSQVMASATGFSLSFASTQALVQLLSSDRVVFYAIGGTRSWKYNAGSAEFEDGAPPVNYYAMDAHTVPRELLRRFAAHVNTGSISWGVTLPAATVAQLELQLQGDGGDLLIDADGGVILNR